jgi:regulator of protease activity HflC (stomatin/prohibitin superfamily)
VKPGTPAFVFVLLIVLFFLVLRAARQVPAGHVGVVDRFGNVRADALPSGLHFVSIHRLSIQIREVKETMDTPSSEGLIVDGFLCWRCTAAVIGGSTQRTAAKDDGSYNS